MKKLFFLLIFICSLLSYNLWNKHHTQVKLKQSYDGFIDLKKAPIQEEINKEMKTININDYKIEFVKSFDISATILAKKEYKSHEILPLDLVFGWNEMSSQEFLAKNSLTISQSNRFYFWRIPSFDIIDRKTIERNSANFHIGSLDEEIKEQLMGLNVGEKVRLKGHLVNVMNLKTGLKFVSSLTRNDTGAGACEVFLVTEIIAIQVD